MATVPISIQDGSILIEGSVDNQDIVFIVDTGDAIGPVFNEADAASLNLPNDGPLNVSGAGGAVEIYATKASIHLGGLVFENEPGAVDTNLEGPSLLGLPFFIKQGGVLAFDFANGTLTVGTSHVAKRHRRVAEVLEQWIHSEDVIVADDISEVVEDAELQLGIESIQEATKDK
jgi:gag-polyprotein putative aspartyl protease